MIIVKVSLCATRKVGIDNHYAFDHFVTGFNGTFEDASNYYLGNIFNMGIWYDSSLNEHEDDLMKCVGIELLSGK